MAIFNYNSERPFRGNPDLHLHYWGREQCLPGHFFGPGVRDVYKIHFIHAGTGEVTVGEQTHYLRPGQAFLTYPHIVTAYTADTANPWTYSWVAFTGEQVDYILAKTALSPEHPIFPMDEQLMPKLYELLTQAAEASDSLDLPLKAIMYEFFSLLLRAVPAVPDVLPLPRQKSIYVEQCLHFLHTHYCENISVEMMSSSLKLDRKYLSSLFKRTIGMPPQQYLLNFRIAKACELLTETLCTIGEISRSVGYQDPLLFSRMFKKVKGCSPKEYRSRHLENDIVL
ncbi:AraC family transcriptional regulator [Paenibacillus odorifer]|jgi:AraC-like DNA-binding protein|uniref:AraC family transcriptional regulator n=1 Tax=Paenibacillus odorifer TaxID=189426 RepID=A0ABX3GGN8_9BACL|nr:AraC family transcriptional regulator [Paenibacillus odorifer]OMC66861.1 AraC family transcriptional regulator [Paenibacillus odorifer]OMC79450.1 AraC family transcriptional regulator [Paenibacillus odorifer]OMD03079.1 AraC family transcriptional regulator [Paenibacillus odorifer]OMD57919.1 AraC family transcriptional regulator [Paenibacillus odorifer]OMD80043.1 AraC family transcriptional regulator [Paenibacillus odorifer]